ncbi:MAG: hypothetical protein ACRDFB_04095 [Rhabdochlamydiaceae bacterium]
MEWKSTRLCWRSMIDRCINPHADTYSNYGGGGISVCERWIDFNNFIEDLGFQSEGLQIDRINNNGNYEPGNCRWATTRKEQGRNRGTTILVEFEGATTTNKIMRGEGNK